MAGWPVWPARYAQLKKIMNKRHMNECIDKMFITSFWLAAFLFNLRASTLAFTSVSAAERHREVESVREREG